MKKMLGCLLAFTLLLTAFSTGTVFAEEARLADGVTVRRAILIGNNAYMGDGNALNGCVNDMNRMAALFESAYFQGVAFERISTKADATGTQILSAINQAATSWGADEDDVTYFFYSGHGWNSIYQNGVSDQPLPSSAQSGIVGIDINNASALISFDTLEAALSRIPGTVVVLLDSCHSGGLIGKGTTTEEYSQAAIDAFSGAAAKGAATTDKYQVLVAASGKEVSWENLSQGGAAGAFTFGLVSGLGMSYKDYTIKSTMAADTNKNKAVTMSEAYKYLTKKVSASGSQTIKMHSLNSSFQLFARTTATKLDISEDALAFTGYGQTKKLTAYSVLGSASFAAEKITWKSSNNRVATVSADGTVTSIGPGKAKIQAVSGKKSASLVVTVEKVPIEQLSLSGDATMTPGQTQTLSVGYQPENATDRSVSFASSNKKVATVDKKGLVKAVAPGSATITAVVKKGSTRYSATLDITVGESVPLERIELADSSMDLLAGITRSFTSEISFYPENASNKSVSVKSSNSKVATAKLVTVSGKTCVSVTPKKAGTAQIVLTSKDGGKVCSMTVKVWGSVTYNTDWTQDVLTNPDYYGDVYANAKSMYVSGKNLCVDFVIANVLGRTITRVVDANVILYDTQGLTEDEYLYTFERAVYNASYSKLSLKKAIPNRSVGAITVKIPLSKLKSLPVGRLDEHQVYPVIMSYRVGVKHGAPVKINAQ